MVDGKCPYMSVSQCVEYASEPLPNVRRGCRCLHQGLRVLMGNVHIRQFCGQLRVVRCTWQMFPDLDSVLAGVSYVPDGPLGAMQGASARVLCQFLEGAVSCKCTGRACSGWLRRLRPSPRRHARPGSRPASPSTACRSLVLTSHLVRAVGGPPAISRGSTCERWRRTLSTDPSPWGLASRTRGRTGCPVERVAYTCRAAPLRARVETPQWPRNRVANAVQTARKRSRNGMQTDQARGVGEPDTRHHDGRTT